MPYTRPDLAALRQRTRAQFAAKLPGADTTLRRSNIAVAADTMAGLVNGEYGYNDWLFQQAFTDTADDEYLLRAGTRYGMAPNGATSSVGNAVFTGIATTPIASGTLLQDSTGAVQFATTADAAVGGGGSVTVAIEATAGGAAANLAASAPLTLVNAIAGVDGIATVDGSGLSGGSDSETMDAFRARVLDRQRQPPQGGILNDYEQWALSVPGVTRAWCYPLNRGLGTADVTFVMDGRDNIIPTDDDVAAVQAVIDAKRPVTDDSVVFAPAASAVNYTIHSLTPNTDAVKAAVTAGLLDMHRSSAIPGGGLSFQDDIVPAVADSAGVTSFTVTVPSTDVAGISGTILTLGTVTFT